MPVTGRIDWILRQVRMGRRRHVTIGVALDPRKCKFKVTLDAAADGCPITPMVEEALIGVLTGLRALAHNGVATDRGHRYSSGISEVSFWVSAAPAGRDVSGLATPRVTHPDASSSSGGPSRGEAASGLAPGGDAVGFAFASSASREAAQRADSPGASASPSTPNRSFGCADVDAAASPAAFAQSLADVLADMLARDSSRRHPAAVDASACPGLPLQTFDARLDQIIREERRKHFSRFFSQAPGSCRCCHMSG